MISDYCGFLEYYSGVPDTYLPYANPLVLVDYDEISIDGEVKLTRLPPFSHVVNLLCYSDADAKAYYNQKRIADVCHVSRPQITAWKNGERTPEKYHWFLLLVDIAEKARAGMEADASFYGTHLVRPGTQAALTALCACHLRMVKAAYEPFCVDDVILAHCVRSACGLEQAAAELLKHNRPFWESLLHPDAG